MVFPDSESAAEHWQRVAMSQAVDAYIGSLHPHELTAAEISGDTHAKKPWKSHTSLNYPSFDLCADLDARSSSSTWSSASRCWSTWWTRAPQPPTFARLCAAGGHVIVSTPFLVKVHELPMYAMNDYWRFTPRGLQTLLERTGLEVDTVGSWGNRACVVGNFDRWSAYRPWHPLRNEPDLPLQVWAFATNPG